MPLLKALILPLFIGSLLLSSCTKQKAITPIQESSNHDENIKNLMTHAKELNEYSLTDLQEYSDEFQRDIFDQMSSGDKVRIWNERIDQFLDDERDAGNTQMDEYTAAMNSLRNIVSANAYENVETKEAAIQATEDWMQSYVALIGYEQTKTLLTTLARINVGNGGTMSGGGTSTSLSGCGCSTEDDWCSGGVLTKCYSGGCTSKSWGCGLLFLSACDGTCHLVA